MKVKTLWMLAAGCLGAGFFPAETRAAGSKEQIDFFEQKIRPVLIEKCYRCHSAAEGKKKGGLTLDSRIGLREGGDSGTALVAGNPDASLLIKAIRYHDEDLQMPPKGKLPGNVIADFEQWIREGAADPREGSLVVATPREVARNHWAFLPIKNPQPPASADPSWTKTPIDQFVLHSLKAEGLEPNPKADKRTLIRRAYYDLVGMPPPIDEFERFMADSSPDAWEKLIDKLLDSPHYGERWGRYWLDVARYADSKGDVNDRNEDHRYPYAWTYRDYVIRSFNEDKPYNQFVLEQLAADKLVERGRAQKDDLAALGFLTVGKRFNNNQNEIIDDRIDVVTKGFLGLTVVCARCHDHKFDPIPTADYYSFHGIFNNITEPSQDELPLLEEVKSTSREYREYAYEVARIQRELEMERQKEEERIKKAARENAGKYLFATWEIQQPTNTINRFIFLNEKGLNSGIFGRWQRFLGSKKKEDALWGPWKTLAAVKPFEWSTKGRELVKQYSANQDEKNPVNAVLARSFRSRPPSNMREVAAIYSSILYEADQQWTKNRVLAARLKREPKPLEENWEQIRLVHYGEDRWTPSNPTGRDMYNLFSQGFQGRLQRFESRIVTAKLDMEGAPVRAMVVQDKSNPRNSHIFIRGDARNRGDEVPRRFLEALSEESPRPFPADTSGRLALAEKIASPDNPLTARVIVNRVWMHHLGEGIVRSPSDFGTRCEPPTHPEMLDWMATWFIDNGWSFKKLHKLIMMSSAYQQSAEDDPRKAQADPGNNLVWKYNVRRLDFEAMRDTILAIGGKLDPTVYGRPVDLMGDPFPTRRTVYGFIDRRRLASIYNTFDFANPDLSTGERYETTVPQQALFLMNNPLVVEQARNLVERGDFRGRTTHADRVKLLYKLIYQREPSTTEIRLAERYLALQGDLELKAGYEKPWMYGFGTYDPRVKKVRVFRELEKFGTSANGTDMWAGGPAYLYMSAEGGHPGQAPNIAAIRRWTVQADGIVEITGNLRHSEERGDGIVGRIVHSRLGALGEWQVKNRQVGATVARVPVKKGETIDFVVDCLRIPGADAFTWTSNVRMLTLRDVNQLPPGSSTTWNSRNDFSGPVEQVEARPLVAWEKYAQVLLLTNELTFYN